MSQSLAKVYLHIIFSTKHRQPLISEEIRPNTQAYFVQVGANLGSYTEEILLMPTTFIGFARSQELSPSRIW